MKVRWLALAGLLCAMRAEGQGIQLTSRMVHVLTPMDELPSKAALSQAFLSIDVLRAIAADDLGELSIQLRAIRSLPTLCAPACGPETLVHEALSEIIARPPSDAKGVLRRRAAIEALGAIRAAIPNDVLVLVPLLDDSNRDVRAAVVRALRNLSDCSAKPALMRRLTNERVQQVWLALTAALSAFEQCH
jgi:HEAT repeat protein